MELIRHNQFTMYSVQPEPALLILQTGIPAHAVTKERLIRHSPLQNTKNSAIWFTGSRYWSDHRFSLAKKPDRVTENTRSLENDQ